MSNSWSRLLYPPLATEHEGRNPLGFYTAFFCPEDVHRDMRLVVRKAQLHVFLCLSYSPPSYPPCTSHAPIARILQAILLIYNFCLVK